MFFNVFMVWGLFHITSSLSSKRISGDNTAYIMALRPMLHTFRRHPHSHSCQLSSFGTGILLQNGHLVNTPTAGLDLTPLHPPQSLQASFHMEAAAPCRDLSHLQAKLSGQLWSSKLVRLYNFLYLNISSVRMIAGLLTLTVLLYYIFFYQEHLIYHTNRRYVT